MTGEGLGEYTDDEAEHGDAAIQEFGPCHAFALDLISSGLLEPSHKTEFVSVNLSVPE